MEPNYHLPLTPSTSVHLKHVFNRWSSTAVCTSNSSIGNVSMVSMWPFGLGRWESNLLYIITTRFQSNSHKPEEVWVLSYMGLANVLQFFSLKLRTLYVGIPFPNCSPEQAWSNKRWRRYRWRIVLTFQGSQVSQTIMFLLQGDEGFQFPLLFC